jgi:hypothetical protein
MPGGAGRGALALGYLSVLGNLCVAAPLLQNFLMHRTQLVCCLASVKPRGPSFLFVPQVYMQETPYRLGRGHTGWLTDLTVYNQSFLVVPGGLHLRS